ncbi:MAG: DUF5658 family protein [Eubacteriales bacterium]
MLGIIVLLNFFDCIFTLFGYLNNYIIELNPINQYLLQNNTIYFILFKGITTILLLLSFYLKGKVNIYLKFYGSTIIIFILTFIFILHIKWMMVIFL